MKQKIIFAGIAVVILVAIGIYFLNSSNIVGEVVLYDEPLYSHNVVNVSEDTIIIIPVKVHLIEDEEGVYTSTRDEEDVRRLMNDANRIWTQGNIFFNTTDIGVMDVSTRAIPNAINGNSRELREHPNYDDNVINLFLTQSLNGLNGLALIRVDSALVADFTTVNDYRTTAHELGHLLGLWHVEPSDKLMARGRNGEVLDDWEVKLARENALSNL